MGPFLQFLTDELISNEENLKRDEHVLKSNEFIFQTSEFILHLITDEPFSDEFVLKTNELF